LRIGTHTVFTLLCSVFVNRMSYQLRLFFSWIVLLSILQTFMKSNTSGCRCCLHAIQHHITFATNGPGLMANFKGCLLHLSNNYENDKSFGQFRQNYQTLLTHIQHFEGVNLSTPELNPLPPATLVAVRLLRSAFWHRNYFFNFSTLCI